jgi:excisionase family DNA binding protein
MRWENDELITVKEIATLLRLNQQTIRNWIDAGTLPHVSVGERRVRVWRSDLVALIEAGATVKQKPAKPGPSIWDGVIPMPITPDQLRS